jgi:hypothetical protein
MELHHQAEAAVKIAAVIVRRRLSSELEQKNAHIAELEAARDQAVTLETARTQYVDLVRALTANARKQEMKDLKALLSETA